MVNSERYNRQIRLFSEKGQEKLSKSSVALVGSDKLSDLILTDLLSLGIGDITRIGATDFFDFEKINPEVCLEQIEEDLSCLQLAKLYLRNKNFIIDATNNPESKMFSLAVAKERNTPYFSVCSDNTSFSISTEKIYQSLIDLHEKEFYQKQGIINSIVCSAILADALRKEIIPLKNDSKFKNFKYSDLKEKDNLEKKIIQVGAGAIGTFSALALSLMNAELTIADFDVIEETNLNRQFLFYGSVGLNKAEVLAERLKKYSQNIKSLNKKIGPDFNPEGYDFILSCVDNNTARYFMNLASAKYNVPLINGGSSISGGNVMPYFPGKTSCLDCQTGFKLSESLEKKKKIRAPGECFQPSLIISNQIMGGLMVDCLIKSISEDYKKSNYSSGYGIFKQEINKKCFDTCKTNSKNEK